MWPVSAREQACSACTTLVQCTLWLFLANCGVWGAPRHPARTPIVRAMCVAQLIWRAYDERPKSAQEWGCSNPTSHAECKKYAFFLFKKITAEHEEGEGGLVGGRGGT